MLEFILKLSFWQGLFLTMVSIALIGAAVIFLVKKYVSPHLKKQHEKLGRLLFRVTAGLIALLISLSYAHERVAQGKIMDALEEEASSLVNSALILKNKLLNNLDRIIQLMQVRIYSQSVLVPNLIYILCMGLLFMWIFYTVYPVDFISMGFITLYNLFIGTLIYFVLALSNPLAGTLKINAHSFEVIQSKGIEKALK